MRNETPCDFFQKNLAFCLSYAFSNTNSLQTITYRTDKNFVIKTPLSGLFFFYLLLFIQHSLDERAPKTQKSFYVAALVLLLASTTVIHLVMGELNHRETENRKLLNVFL